MQLLCKNPESRLRDLERFKMQPFFRGCSFDPLILQKSPVDIILELRAHPDWTATARRGFDSFDCDEILHFPSSELISALTNIDPSSKTCEAGDDTVMPHLKREADETRQILETTNIY